MLKENCLLELLALGSITAYCISACCSTGRFWIKNWQDLHLPVKCHSRHFPFFLWSDFFVFYFCFILLHFFDVFSKKKPWSLHILDETILLKQTNLHPSDHWVLNTIFFFRLGALTIVRTALLYKSWQKKTT